MWPWARLYCRLIAEAYETSVDAAEERAVYMLKQCEGDEYAFGYWSQLYTNKLAKNWLKAARKDRAKAREQLTKIVEDYQRRAKVAGIAFNTIPPAK